MFFELIETRAEVDWTDFTFEFGIHFVATNDDFFIVDEMHGWNQMFICMPRTVAIRVGLEYARRISNWRMYECADTLYAVTDFADRWNLQYPIEM